MQDENNLIYLKHNLGMLGLPSNEQLRDKLFLYGEEDDLSSQINWSLIEKGALVVFLQPNTNILKKLRISVRINEISLGNFRGHNISSNREYALKTLHPYCTYFGDGGDAIVKDQSGCAVWLSVKFGAGHILIIGSDIEQDILRFRQGDPSSIVHGDGGELWGVKGERPNYLFEKQLGDLPKYARQADYWPHLLVSYICTLLKIKPVPILPGNAPGAIIITGDDDQAFLEKYEEQQILLDGAPITYFLHPKTKHTKKTLRSMFKRKNVDFGIHPDALDSPNKYSSLFIRQCKWYRDLIPEGPISLRNHGYLNRGYWGHLYSWLSEGVRISSNIPGLDGRIINSSLLPAKIFIESTLVNHWSILTAIGDGVRYILNKSDVESAACIYDLRDSIVNDDIPGIIVINLHPQNVSDTKLMHFAVKQIISAGFIAWTMRDCLIWFEEGRYKKPNSKIEKLLSHLR